MAKANIADVKRCEEVQRTGVSPAPSAEQRFVLQVIQPGLARLMDGSVSTLPPSLPLPLPLIGPIPPSWSVWPLPLRPALAASGVYFQDAALPCNKRAPGTGCPARAGYHRNLAILGASEACIATHPSDMAVALMALDASIRVLGSAGERTIPIGSFYRLPGSEPQHVATLAHDELITAVDLPPVPSAKYSLYRKARDRASYAFALVSVAAILEVADGKVGDVRLALGGVAHMPWRATRAEEILRDGAATETAFRRAVEAELAQARPLRDNAFKVPLVHNMIVQALLDLARAQP